ncbi:MAG: ATP-binding protein [Acidobacteriaceae bacterium]|nr:ATP-binding protein [Acidobacteriaceae bacterium]
MHVFLLITTLALAAACLALLARAQTTTRRLQAALQQAQQQLQAKDKALAERMHLDSLKDEFVSTVSHELRTPLTSIRGALGLLSAGVHGHVDEKAASLLRIANNNTDRLVRLINDILDLERMDSGQASMQHRTCVLRDLIAQAVETMSAMAQEHKVLLEVRPEPAGAPATFEGDPDRIQQVLVNLLSNAIKFSPAGEKVVLFSNTDGDSLFFRVVDFGKGIPADKLDAVFGRFTQVEEADARQKGGTGLGLAICRAIVSQHHGSIWAKRNDADGAARAGTTFYVHLPRSQPAESNIKATSAS